MVSERVIPPHPFPARMASDLALDAIRRVRKGGRILDPMCGSGTVPYVAARNGYNAVGMDVDPLAVLIATVWTNPVQEEGLLKAAHALVVQAKRLRRRRVQLPWIDNDDETSEFVDYWFADAQQRSLRSLAYLLHRKRGPKAKALRLVLSRLIVTKERGASLARDVSHSRPHRVKDENDFDVFEEFQKAARVLCRRLEQVDVRGTASIAMGDARALKSIGTGSIDAVVTSPPYLNAIDYIRGHRLALVWLGYDLPSLRKIRGGSVGAERGPDKALDERDLAALGEGLRRMHALPNRVRSMVRRYMHDIKRLVAEVARVLKPRGRATFVVGASTLRGVYIANARIVSNAAALAGLSVEDACQRTIPPNTRYLPPPSSSRANALANRIRSETVLTLARSS